MKIFFINPPFKAEYGKETVLFVLDTSTPSINSDKLYNTNS